MTDRITIHPPAEIAKIGEPRNRWIKAQVAQLEAEGRHPVIKRGQRGYQTHIIADAEAK